MAVVGRPPGLASELIREWVRCRMELQMAGVSSLELGRAPRGRDKHPLQLALADGPCHRLVWGQCFSGAGL